MRVAIRGGTVVDGTGGPGRRADLLVVDGRVAEIGDFDAEAETIDAEGLMVAPGFVDLHSHSDYTLLVDPRAMSAIHQGVTTEVVGNCGFGCFPIRDASLARRAIYGYSDDLPVTWSSAGEYFDALDAAPVEGERPPDRARCTRERPRGRGRRDRPELRIVGRQAGHP